MSVDPKVLKEIQANLKALKGKNESSLTNQEKSYLQMAGSIMDKDLSPSELSQKGFSPETISLFNAYAGKKADKYELAAFYEFADKNKDGKLDNAIESNYAPISEIEEGTAIATGKSGFEIYKNKIEDKEKSTYTDSYNKYMNGEKTTERIDYFKKYKKEQFEESKKWFIADAAHAETDTEINKMKEEYNSKVKNAMVPDGKINNVESVVYAEELTKLKFNRRQESGVYLDGVLIKKNDTLIKDNDLILEKVKKGESLTADESMKIKSFKPDTGKIDDNFSADLDMMVKNDKKYQNKLLAEEKKEKIEQDKLEQEKIEQEKQNKIKQEKNVQNKEFANKAPEEISKILKVSSDIFDVKTEKYVDSLEFGDAKQPYIRRKNSDNVLIKELTLKDGKELMMKGEAETAIGDITFAEHKVKSIKVAGSENLEIKVEFEQPSNSRGTIYPLTFSSYKDFADYLTAINKKSNERNKNDNKILKKTFPDLQL